MFLGWLTVAVLSSQIRSEASSDQRETPSIGSLLAKQRFSGLLKGDVHFANLGTLNCGSQVISILFYEWYESPPHGAAIHASQRVVLMRGQTYLGAYVVDDRPTISDNKIRFPYPAQDGNVITCETGGIPAKVFLNRDIVPLAK